MGGDRNIQYVDEVRDVPPRRVRETERLVDVPRRIGSAAALRDPPRARPRDGQEFTGLEAARLLSARGVHSFKEITPLERCFCPSA